MGDEPLHQRLDQAGRKMQKAGGILTLAITVPVAGLLLFGWLGLIVGVLIPVAVFTAKRRSDGA